MLYNSIRSHDQYKTQRTCVTSTDDDDNEDDKRWQWNMSPLQISVIHLPNCMLLLDTLFGSPSTQSTVDIAAIVKEYLLDLIRQM